MTDQRISDQPKTLSAANPETGDTAMLRGDDFNGFDGKGVAA